MRARVTGVLIQLTFVLLVPISSRAQHDERWVELVATPQTKAARDILFSLGFEVHPGAVEGEETRFGRYEVVLMADEIPALDQNGIEYTVVHADLAEYYRAGLSGPTPAFERMRTPSRLGVGSMGGYFTWSEVIAEMDTLQAAHPSRMLPKESIGTTLEGRPLWIWKLSTNPQVDEDEPEIIVMSLTHAREPASMMSVVYLVERLLLGYGTDPEVTYLLDHRELWVIPVVNPDGYVYNQTTNPTGGGLWRKNRRNNGDGTFGVDPNRNFGYLWGYDDTGSSPTTSASSYRGPGPFSERETQALRDFTIAHQPTVSVSVHTSGDLLIRPWGYADLLTPDDASFSDISKLMTRANAYTPGTVMATLNYVANGSCDDWMYGETSLKPRVFGLTPELGRGFWPATALIPLIAQETLPLLRNATWVSGSSPRLDRVVYDDLVGGDGDGWVEPGETVAVTIDLRNHGLAATWGDLAANLQSTSCHVFVEDANSNYGVVDRQTTAAGVDTFRIYIGRAEPGTIVPLTLTLTDDRGAYPPIALRLLVGQPTVRFSDDLESGISQWTLTGWGLEAAGGSANGQALSDSPGGNHPANVDTRAQIATSFNLSGSRHAWLTFAQRFWIDNDYSAGRVEVSTDGGTTWRSLAGEDSDVPSGVGRQNDGQPVYDGHIFDWQSERVDLSSVSGSGFTNVRIRFRFLGDTADYDGWHVDDVVLLAFTGAASACPFCGDATADPDESCDDGNTTDCDGCSATCAVEFCGDALVCMAAGETCDDGNTTDCDGCSANCATESCGDGLLCPSAGESCDDGNTTNCDGCSAACAVESCGDGLLCPSAGESCDDGNTTNCDGCSTACAIESCGDGLLCPSAGESCDDGNTTSGDGCNDRCELEGACCANGSCQDLSGLSCANTGGMYVGDGSACADAPSPCPSCNVSMLGPIQQLLATKTSAFADVVFTWNPDAQAGDGYEVWYVDTDKRLIPACGSCNPGRDVLVCPPTGVGVTTCMQAGAVAGAAGEVRFYDVIGNCFGVQGAP